MHRWRTEELGILVGRNTVTVDDCELTARLWQGKNPTRIVIDRKSVLPKSRKIFNSESATIVFNESIEGIEENICHIKIDFEKNVLEQILQHLYLLQIQSVMVEGGAATLQYFKEKNLWDEARVFSTTHVLKEGKAVPQLTGEIISELEIENDYLKIFINPDR